MALSDPKKYFIESRHAFKTFIQKSFTEIKSLFSEGLFTTVADEYQVEVQDNNTKLSEDLARLNIEEPPAMDGIVSFQLRYYQNDKQIMLLGYANHNWGEPNINTPTGRKWGKITIDILVQNKYSPLLEKQTLRKMNIYIHISYLKRKDLNNIYHKIQVVSGKTEWISMQDLEAEVEQRLKEKKTTIVAIDPRGADTNDPYFPRHFPARTFNGQRGTRNRNLIPIQNHGIRYLMNSNPQDPWDIPQVVQQEEEYHQQPRAH